MALNINEYKPEDIDLKIEKRVPLVCKQFDDIILNFNVSDYGVPINLSNYLIDFRIQQNNGITYKQTTGITKSGNSIRVVCSKQVTEQTGKTKIELDFVALDGLKKSSFVIIITVKESIALTSRMSEIPNDMPIEYAIEFNDFENYVIQAKALNAEFSSNIETQKQVQASLDASVKSAKSTANSVADSLVIASNLNVHLEEARALNSALQSNITTGSPLNTQLGSTSTSALATKTALEADIAIADKKIDEFKSFDTSGLVTKVNTLQSSVTAIEGKVEALESFDGTALNTKVDNLKIDVDTAKSNVANVQAKANALQIDVDSSKTNIAVAQAKVNTMQIDVNASKTNVSNLQTKVDTIKSDVDTNKVNIAGVQTKVNALQVDVDTYKSNMTGAQAKISTLQTDVANSKSNISTLQTDMTGVQNKVNALQLDVDNSELEMINVKSTVNTLKSDFDSFKKNPSFPSTGGDANVQSKIDALRLDVDDAQADIVNAKMSITNMDNTIRGDILPIQSTLQANVASIKSDVSAVKGTKTTLKEGIIDLISMNAPIGSGGVNNATVAGLVADVEAAKLGTSTLLSGIRSAINDVTAPMKAEISDIVLTGTDAKLKAEVLDARFGLSTLKLGIQKAINDVKGTLDLKIDAITVGTDPVLLNEIANARNGQTTLKGGIQSMINVTETKLQKEIANVSRETQDTELRAEIRDAEAGYDNLRRRLDAIVSDASNENDLTQRAVNNVIDDVRSCKNGANATLKEAVQTMIEDKFILFQPPDSAISVDKIDNLNANIMNVILSNEKMSGHPFIGLSDSMRVYSFVNLDSHLRITNGLYDSEKKCIKSNNITLESIAFCYD